MKLIFEGEDQPQGISLKLGRKVPLPEWKTTVITTYGGDGLSESTHSSYGPKRDKDVWAKDHQGMWWFTLGFRLWVFYITYRYREYDKPIWSIGIK